MKGSIEGVECTGNWVIATFEYDLTSCSLSGMSTILKTCLSHVYCVVHFSTSMNHFQHLTDHQPVFALALQSKLGCH